MLGPKCCWFGAALTVALVVVARGAGSVSGKEYVTKDDEATCDEKSWKKCDVKCTDLGLPICRKNKKTFKNWCWVMKERCCVQHTEGGKFVPYDYVGPCRDRSKDSEEEKKKYGIEPWPPSVQHIGGDYFSFWNVTKYLEGYPVSEEKLRPGKSKKKGATSTVAPAATESASTGAPPARGTSTTKRPAEEAGEAERKTGTSGRPASTTAGRHKLSPLRRKGRPHKPHFKQATASNDTIVQTTLPAFIKLSTLPLVRDSSGQKVPSRLGPRWDEMEAAKRRMLAKLNAKAARGPPKGTAAAAADATTTTSSKPKLLPIKLIGSGSVIGTSPAKVPECKKRTCPAEYEPICASDGKFYRNKCEFDNAVACNVVKLTKDPYYSECCQQKENLTGHYEQLCAKFASCTKGCSKSSAPICASDGVTYRAECEFLYASCGGKNITVDHHGKCGEAAKVAAEVRLVEPDWPCKTPCLFIYEPVCDLKGKRYDNPCLLANAACDDPTIKEGPCGPKKSIHRASPVLFDSQPARYAGCASNCSQVRVPVCGSDCQTYRNLCTYEREMCLARQEFTMVRKGRCEEFSECRRVTRKLECLRDCRAIPQTPEQLVCGSDHKTYRNTCLLELEACERNDPTLLVQYKGACKVVRAGAAPPISCNKTTCLGLATCQASGQCICKTPSPIERLQTLRLLKLGVCASDGRSYGSTLEISHVACVRRQKIGLVHVGPCNGTEPATLGADCASVQCLGGAKCRMTNGKAECACDHRCSMPDSSEWLCASDGVSYPSKCRMDEAACIKRTALTKVKDGPCQGTTEAPELEPEAEAETTTVAPLD